MLHILIGSLVTMNCTSEESSRFRKGRAEADTAAHHQSPARDISACLHHPTTKQTKPAPHFRTYGNGAIGDAFCTNYRANAGPCLFNTQPRLSSPSDLLVHCHKI